MLKLEEKEISYHVINENTTFIKKDFNDKNKYNDYYKEALKKIEVGDKVMILLDKVKKSNKKELEKLLEVISEFYN